VLAEQVLDRFDHRNINLEVPDFADGRLIPTGENLARFIGEHVQRAFGDMVRVRDVRVAEDDRLWATWTQAVDRR
jgi:6-pyruvoyltetrahydropterin/6-carboxytetrahydropterin synthase